MTHRKTDHNYQCGKLLRNLREKLTDLPRSRKGFIEDREKTIFGGENWISEKTLINYETGKNIPTLSNIKKLALALEVDVLDLIQSILDVLDD